MSPSPGLEEVKNLFGHLLLDTDHLTTKNSAYHELTNTGNLSIFNNHELKESITDYYRNNEEITTGIEEFNNVTTQLLVETVGVVRNFYKFIDVQKAVVAGYPPMYNDPNMYFEGEWNFINEPTSIKFQALESMVFLYWYRNVEHLSFFEKLKLNGIELISQINEEIESRK